MVWAAGRRPANKVGIVYAQLVGLQLARRGIWHGTLGDAFMSRVIHGKVHGATIELSQPLDIADGQEVEVTLRTVSDKAKSKQSGEGIRRSAGPLPDDSERDDELLAEIQRRRRSARSREVAE